MTYRDRVIAALQHKKTDIVPYQLDLTDEVDARLLREIGSDVYKRDSHLAQERNESFTVLSKTRFRDMFGVLWSKEQEGDFGIVAEYPLAEPEFGAYQFPAPDEALIREKCERLCRQKDKFRMYIIGFSLFERAWTLRSMPEFLIDMLENKEFAHELLDRIVAYNLAVVDIVAEYAVDCVFFGDDWGQQRGLIMGLPLWREFLLPQLKRMYAHVKAKGKYVAQHSCGDISQAFPDLIDIGLDIYNTFQPEIYDVAEMKRRYGDQITFYGGISTQRLLPFATPDQVRAETTRLIGVLGCGGGYICAPTHSMPDDIPTENVLAFLEAARQTAR